MALQRVRLDLRDSITRRAMGSGQDLTRWSYLSYGMTQTVCRIMAAKASHATRHRALSTGAIFVPDQKAIVIGIIHGLAYSDFPPAELQTADRFQLVAGLETLVFGQMFVFTIAAWRRNHMTPRFLGKGL